MLFVRHKKLPSDICQVWVGKLSNMPVWYLITDLVLKENPQMLQCMYHKILHIASEL